MNAVRSLLFVDRSGSLAMLASGDHRNDSWDPAALAITSFSSLCELSLSPSLIPPSHTLCLKSLFARYEERKFKGCRNVKEYSQRLGAGPAHWSYLQHLISPFEHLWASFSVPPTPILKSHSTLSDRCDLTLPCDP